MMKDPYTDKSSLPYKFRKRRSRQVLEIIDSVLAEKDSCRILDIGGTQQYWDILADELQTRNVTIELLNMQRSDQADDERFHAITGDATDLADYEDNAYDFVHSNSVIEHVGNWSQMRRMASNVKRLAPRYYVQTPYFWFPFEPHFRFPMFHWFPEQVRSRLLLRRRLGYYPKEDRLDTAIMRVQGVYLLDNAQFSILFDDGEIRREKALLFTKSLIAVRH